MGTLGPITELVAIDDQDNDLTDSTNLDSLFDYSIIKKNKYTKGDHITWPSGCVNWSNTIRFEIERIGDLLYGIYLIVKLPKISVEDIRGVTEKLDENDPSCPFRVKYCDYIGNVIIEKVSLYFNGQLIDEQYGEYMQIYTDLYVSDSNRKAMIGMDDYLNLPNLKINPEYIYIPLNFWFCNQIETPLPIVAMTRTTIHLDVKFRDFNSSYMILKKTPSGLWSHQDLVLTEVSLSDVKLQTNFYYLNLDERKSLGEKLQWEILITQSQRKQIQFRTSVKSIASLDIDFNHVVKDIFFYVRPDSHVKYGDFFNFSSKMSYLPNKLSELVLDQTLWLLEPKRHLLSRARILFNGIERIEWRDGKYFHRMQNFENYQNTVRTMIYMYSFNADPTGYTNNSGCNFSRISVAQLQVEIVQPDWIVWKTNEQQILYPKYDSVELVCFATNFNILVIKNGQVSLKYSN
jgi:hypothetical protein